MKNIRWRETTNSGVKRHLTYHMYNVMLDTCINDRSGRFVDWEDYLYFGMKNDISFLIKRLLVLFEQQSTDNPNMPLRAFFYLGKQYQGVLSGENLYGSKEILLPYPVCLVFYNGKAERPDTWTGLISSAYAVDSHLPKGLEIKVWYININYGKNQEIMKRCKKLHDYAYFVYLVRQYKETMNLIEAINAAVAQCIREDV